MDHSLKKNIRMLVGQGEREVCRGEITGRDMKRNMDQRQ